MNIATNTTIPCIGYEIAADWYEGESSQVLLVLVGHMSSKANYEAMVSELVRQTGTSALVIEYTGHGESPFELSELMPAQNFLEVVTAFDWLRDNHPDKTISVMGTSYGGFLATQLTKYRTFEKLILRVPALYPPGDFYTKWKDIPNKHFTEYRAFLGKEGDILKHPLLARASQFRGKSFVIIHEHDEVCPEISTRAFAEALGAEVWVAYGFKHGFAASKPTPEQKKQYYHKIVEWLSKSTIQ